MVALVEDHLRIHSALEQGRAPRSAAISCVVTPNGPAYCSFVEETQQRIAEYTDMAAEAS